MPLSELIFTERLRAFISNTNGRFWFVLESASRPLGFISNTIAGFNGSVICVISRFLDVGVVTLIYMFILVLSTGRCAGGDHFFCKKYLKVKMKHGELKANLIRIDIFFLEKKL